MNCQEFESRLNALLDERAPLELDGDLRGHARRCPPCRELAAGYAEMAQAVRFRPLPEPAADLAGRIVAAAMAADVVVVVRERPTAAGRRWHRWAVASAAAAIIVAAIGWRFWPTGAGTTQPGGPQIVKAPSETGQTQGRPLSDLAQDAAKCYAGLARETRSDLSDVLALAPGMLATRVEGSPAAMAPSAVFPKVLWNAGEAAPPTPEVASHVRDGLRPLTQTTLAAFTSLFGSSQQDPRDELLPQEKTMPGEKSAPGEKREL